MTDRSYKTRRALNPYHAAQREWDNRMGTTIADRRAWRLHLTPRAHGVVDDMEQISSELFRQAQRGISAADMKAMMAMLTRMKDNLNALDESGA